MAFDNRFVASPLRRSARDCSDRGALGKRRLTRMVMALLPVAFILAGCAPAPVHGRAGGAAEADSFPGYDQIRSDPAARRDDMPVGQRPVEGQSEFEMVMRSACAAGDVFGCGLLQAWRALLAAPHFLEKLVTLGLIALSPFLLISTSMRKHGEKRRGKATEMARDAAIGPRSPMPDSFTDRAPKNARRRIRRTNRRVPSRWVPRR